MGGRFSGGLTLDTLVEDFESDSNIEFAMRLKHILVLLADDYRKATWLDAHEYLVRWEQKVIDYDDDNLTRLYLACLVMVRAQPSKINI